MLAVAAAAASHDALPGWGVYDLKWFGRKTTSRSPEIPQLHSVLSAVGEMQQHFLRTRQGLVILTQALPASLI